MPSPTNPFSRFLRAQDDRPRPDVDAFVAAWDRLETLVIAIYRAGAADAADEADFAALRTELEERYPALAADLAPHWPGVRGADGADPFRLLLEVPRAAAFAGNRAALRALPAAREALNRWLVVLAREGEAEAEDG